MKKIFDLLGLGKANAQKTKRLVVISILITAALIVALLAAFVIVQIASKPDQTPEEDDETENVATYVTVQVSAADVYAGDLILVNKNNLYTFTEGAELVEMSKYIPENATMKADKTALEALNKMLDALSRNVSGADVKVTTAFRSADEQTKLNNGTPAGASDFHTGRLFELKDGKKGVDEFEKYEWLYKNAHKYGFIVRYPADTEEKAYSEMTGVKNFTNAFRYVGVAHATYMYNEGLCFEEYIELLKSSYVYGTAELTLKAGNSNYVIYYVRSAGDLTDIQVPAKYKYEISGNNIDGYIVTVNKSSRAN